ncbi:uncharacterized protein K02A2.6-like [Corticium candelabrum]|uniref:uncharacterized protein K02A2.6-like n=1 Tax=Corticium candelabrum TaxID=121492 RepID=UPI002E270E04|nr:uncharacterized protein K02A2.6-like [Corticium candelabrum]
MTIGNLSKLDEILSRYQSLFSEELGEYKGPKARILIDSAEPPRFCKVMSVLYALRQQVADQLKLLESEGILKPVDHVGWAAPMVPVIKPDKSIRICGDFKYTISRATRMNKYPISQVEDLLARLAKGKYFTKLDLSQAYNQLLLPEKSQQYTTINTFRGLLQYTRLPFGISSAPSMFQRVLESVLQGTNDTDNYLDDILIATETETEHVEQLDAVLRRLSKAGFHLRRDKCTFMATSVSYLGHNTTLTVKEFIQTGRKCKRSEMPQLQLIVKNYAAF